MNFPKAAFLIAVNTLVAAACLVAFFILQKPKTIEFSEARSKIENSKTIDELRPRALHGISALDHSQDAIFDLYKFSKGLSLVCVGLAIFNLSFLWPYFKRSN